MGAEGDLPSHGGLVFSRCGFIFALHLAPNGHVNLPEFLHRSRATESFQAAVKEFLRTGRPNPGVEFDPRHPPVKVERTLTKILEHYADAPIERVELDASSGCEFFRGVATVQSAEGERRVRFYWDCRWRAEEEGWTDFFGFPDQARAAREFGYDCFRDWNEEAVAQSA